MEQVLKENVTHTQAILEDYLHPQLKFPEGDEFAELDIFIPSLNLAFEYQGIE